MGLNYKNQHLCLGKIELRELVRGRDEPFYIYDLANVRRRLIDFRASFLPLSVKVFYAVKANANLQLLKVLQSENCGVDVVSGGEIRLALASGFQGKDIIFSGVGKTEKELEFAIEQDLHQINVESIPELERIARIGERLRKKISVAFRLNPHVNPQTHPYITTGLRENKFGMDLLDLPRLEEIILSHKESLRLQGVTLHIGSQIWDTSAIREAVEKIKPIFLNLREKGFPVTSFDIGGGLGVDYLHGNEKKEEDLLKTYGSDMAKQLSDLNAEVYCEPGRFLVAHAGVLLAQVQYVKRTPYKNFLILNTGMHHLMRPSLYQAFHRIFPLTAEDPDSAGHELYDVVGPICESADVLGRDRRFSLPKEGDWFAIADVGAYGWVMANHYNAHSLPDEVVLGEGQ